MVEQATLGMKVVSAVFQEGVYIIDVETPDGHLPFEIKTLDELVDLVGEQEALVAVDAMMLDLL